VLRQAVANSRVHTTLTGHTHPMNGVAISPDNQHIASASADGTVRVWLAAGDADPVVLIGHNAAVNGVAFSPNGQRLASAGQDGTVRVWQCEVCGSIEEVLALAEQRTTREMTCEERRTFLDGPPCPQSG
jgi:WD40 repeat protein